MSLHLRTPSAAVDAVDVVDAVEDVDAGGGRPTIWSRRSNSKEVYDVDDSDLVEDAFKLENIPTTSSLAAAVLKAIKNTHAYNPRLRN
ncbi:uncharacterized protein STEHIDRAFT_158017 [Stereum hirsutum FP-91666 SS1]|uniref:uncharacterized protein n=1 Tax=Stereum hirsutum (strain FP-91666) TaxID=721885 RepID=UPI000444A76F|nr:uncharacterized protein STEHIDRAFT_158017 [Stereum hirsutum FP-91666 SS1]EIM85382.1 hypothetical protein STEHIDRAFT_158017 [Stereum hirsutum FP-91666 SS1]